MDQPDQAGTAQAPVHRYAPFGQPLRDQLSGAQFLEGQLGVSVDVTAQLRHFGRLRDQGIDQFHSKAPAMGTY